MNEDEKYAVQLASESSVTVADPPTPLGTMQLTPPPPKNIEVTATNADEMALCQNALIEWCKVKVAETKAHHHELNAAYLHAKKSKWKHDTLKRHTDIAFKRLSFYERILVALEHGYQIVPSFPITAFAIRTDRTRPLKLATFYWRQSHEQKPEGLPEGEGDYKNPFPTVYERIIERATATTAEKKEYYCSDHWKELEFPVSMAKPKIMEAATRAMALKIFDDLGVLPGYSPKDNTRPPKGDPMIIARIQDPASRHKWATPVYVSFIVAWHLNTATL